MIFITLAFYLKNSQVFFDHPVYPINFCKLIIVVIEHWKVLLYINIRFNKMAETADRVELRLLAVQEVYKSSAVSTRARTVKQIYARLSETSKPGWAQLLI